MEYSEYPDHLVQVAERNGLEFEPINKQWLSFSGLVVARYVEDLGRYLERRGWLATPPPPSAPQP